MDHVWIFLTGVGSGIFATLLGIFAGAWLQYRGSVSLSPMPDQRTGGLQQGDESADSEESPYQQARELIDEIYQTAR